MRNILLLVLSILFLSFFEQSAQGMGIHSSSEARECEVRSAE